MAADFSDTEEILGLDQSIRFGQKRSREESKESANITFFGSTSSSEFQIQFPPSPKAREVSDDIFIEEKPPSPYSITATFEDLFTSPSSAPPVFSSQKLQFGTQGNGVFPYETFSLNRDPPSFQPTTLAAPILFSSNKFSAPVAILSTTANLTQQKQQVVQGDGQIFQQQQQQLQQRQMQQQQLQQQQQPQQRPKAATMRPVVRNDPPGLSSETSLSTNLASAPPRGGSGNQTLNSSSVVSSSLVQPTIVPPFSLMPSTSFDGVPASISSLLRELSENSESVVLPSLVSSRFQRRKTHKISIDQIKNSFRQQARSGDSFIGIYSVQERKDRMDVWAAARRKRTFKKNIKYAHRHDLAGGRQRIGGRFVKSKGDESSVQRQSPPIDLEIGTTRMVIVEELNGV